MTLKELVEGYANETADAHRKIYKTLIIDLKEISELSHFFKEQLYKYNENHTFECRYCHQSFYSELGLYCPKCARSQE